MMHRMPKVFDVVLCRPLNIVCGWWRVRLSMEELFCYTPHLIWRYGSVMLVWPWQYFLLLVKPIKRLQWYSVVRNFIQVLRANGESSSQKDTSNKWDVNFSPLTVIHCYKPKKSMISLSLSHHPLEPTFSLSFILNHQTFRNRFSCC